MASLYCYKAEYLTNKSLCSARHKESTKAKAEVKPYVICQSLIVWREYPKNMAERWCHKDVYAAVGMRSFVTVWDYTTNSI